MDEKRTVKQKLTREAKIKKGLATPFANRHGMTPKQIHKALQKTGSSRVEKQKTVRKVAKKPDDRPKRKVRGLSGDRSLLLEVPVVSMHSVAKYPTPEWFTWPKKRKADVSVIVPMYKSAGVIKDLIASWDLKENLQVEMVLVDDACPHQSKEQAINAWGKRREEIKYPVGQILYSPTNQGFGVSCNIGAAHATGDYLIFLNADTTVTPGWIRPIVRLLKKEEVGIVGNMQIRHGGVWKDTIDSAGSQWDWGTRSFRHIGRDIYNGIPINNAFRLDNCPKDIFEVQEREMVTGCCIAVRRDVFEEVGGFNPNYRIGYWEDSELCLSVREKGYKVMYQPNSKIYHKGSHSQSGSHKYAAHNVNFFANKWINSGRIDSLVAAPRKEPLREVGNILLRRHSAHGDVLVASAVAAALKKKYPHCKVMFNTEMPEVLKGNPHIDRTLQTHEISERLFQLYYNLDAAYEFRPHANILEAYADVVGVKPEDCELFIDQEEYRIPREDYIVMHCGKTNWAGRNWTPMKFEIVSSKLMSMNRTVVLVGSPNDFNVSKSLDLTGRLNIQQLAYVIANARMFIGIDSFPMHVAQAVDTPGVCFFGSIDPSTRIVNDKMKPITADNLPCLGCHHRQPPPSVLTSRCELEVQECINKVSIKMMMDRIEEVWENTNVS